MENLTKTTKIITKEEYHQLKNYQDLHNWILKFLDSVENKALLITGEIDSSNEPYLGGYTSDALNGSSYQAIDDVLKILEIEVEQDKIVEKSKKDVGKITKKKKKFKSGQWAKRSDIDVHREIIDSPELHSYMSDFKETKLFLSPEELEEIMKIGNDENDSLSVSENWNHDNDELGDVVG